MKTVEELKSYYDALGSTFEGYIQMSNEKLKIVDSKPSWESLHHDNNFIFEACLFDGDRSIIIRQVNDKFLIVDEKISTYKNTTGENFIATTGKSVKIVQVWDDQEDEHCLDMKVQTPTLQLFAGFEKGEVS